MTWKHILIAIITILILNYVSGVFENRLEQKVSTRQRLEQEVAVLETYAQSEQIQENAGALFQALPANFNKIRVRKLLDELENSANVTFTSIESRKVSEGSSQLSTSSNSENEGQRDLFQSAVNVREYSVTVEGTFPAQIQLLKELESAERFISIKEFTFQGRQSSDQENPTLTNELVLEFYYQDSL
ncbi:MAG: hypothetical protein ABEI13_00890 [Candidatus Paceibacteria bacterium]